MFDPSPAIPTTDLTSTDPLTVALALAAEGKSVIPLRPSAKVPLVPWQAFQRRRATEAEIRTWWRRWPNAGIAVVCGAVSSLVVVDVDPKNGADVVEWTYRLPATRQSLSGRGDGGGHWWYELPTDGLTSSLAAFPGVDVLAEGRYVVVPPSRHPFTGDVYAWVDTGDLAPLPEFIVDAVKPALMVLPDAPTPSRPVIEQPSFAELWAELGIVLLSGEHNYPCPFHDDGAPSLSVNADAELWNCHGCGKGGRYGSLWKAARPGQSPGRPELDKDALALLDRCDAVVKPGKTPLHDKLYRATVRKARADKTLSVQVPVRTMAEDASCSIGSVSAGYRRLAEDGLVRQVSSGRHSLSGSVVELLDPDSLRLNSHCRVDTEGTSSTSLSTAEAVQSQRLPRSNGLIDLSHDVFRHGALSSAVTTLMFLASVGTATPRAIKEATGVRQVDTIYKHLERSVTAGYAQREGDGTWSFATPTPEQLDEVAEHHGTAGRGAALRARNADQRERWPQALDDLQEHRRLARAAGRAQAVRPTVVPDETTGQVTRTHSALEALALGIVPASRRLIDVETGELVSMRTTPVTQALIGRKFFSSGGRGLPHIAFLVSAGGVDPMPIEKQASLDVASFGDAWTTPREPESLAAAIAKVNGTVHRKQPKTDEAVAA